MTGREVFPDEELRRRIMDFIMAAGQTLLENGAEVFRVEQTMEIMARSFHLREFHVYVLTNGIFASAGTAEISEVRNVPSRTTHLSRVAAVNALSRETCLLNHTACSVILTPHPKEFSRLSGLAVSAVLENPAQAAAEFARRHRCVVLLKGADTHVTDGSEIYTVRRGGAGMATAGSGDVLTGILTGMLGYLPPTAKTAACAAYLAGLAGEIAEAENTDIAMVASDTVRAIPAAVKRIRAGEV